MAETGSVGEVAKRLGMSAPAVSQQLKNLTAAVGAPLIDQGRRTGLSVDDPGGRGGGGGHGGSVLPIPRQESLRSGDLHRPGFGVYDRGKL